MTRKQQVKPAAVAYRFDAMGGGSTVITNARTPNSAEMNSRVRRYTITMAFRTACFVAMVFVEGPLRWVLFACAVFLPYVAVLFANQANQRDRGGADLPTVLPTEAPQITDGRPRTDDVITGQLADDEPYVRRRAS